MSVRQMLKFPYHPQKNAHSIIFFYIIPVINNVIHIYKKVINTTENPLESVETSL